MVSLQLEVFMGALIVCIYNVNVWLPLGKTLGGTVFSSPYIHMSVPFVSVIVCTVHGIFC